MGRHGDASGQAARDLILSRPWVTVLRGAVCVGWGGWVATTLPYTASHLWPGMAPLSDPEFLPFKLDPVARRVLWVRLSAAQRRDAAFLDERALPGTPEGGWSSLDALLAPSRPERATAPADAIFHIGHCGSTLLSRLLDTWPQVQGLREPLPLRTLAHLWPDLDAIDSRLSPTQAQRAMQALWRHWSRALPPHTRVVIKATSLCNGLIAPLLSQQPAMRAVLIDMPLRPYLATLLKSADSVRDAASAAGERLRDLHARGAADEARLHALSLPQQCAMGWAAEQLRFAAIAQAHGERVLRVDFERLLQRPEATLHEVAAHFALEPGGVAAALASPAWRRYSKQQAHDYGRDDRAHDLALSLQRHAAEIGEGEAWVRDFARRHPQWAVSF